VTGTSLTDATLQFVRWNSIEGLASQYLSFERIVLTIDSERPELRDRDFCRPLPSLYQNGVPSQYRRAVGARVEIVIRSTLAHEDLCLLGLGTTSDPADDAFWKATMTGNILSLAKLIDHTFLMLADPQAWAQWVYRITSASPARSLLITESASWASV
jgi:hypothetical protein